MANPTSVQQRDLPSSSVSLAFDWIDRDFAREKAKWPTTQWLDLVFQGVGFILLVLKINHEFKVRQFIYYY